MLSMSIREHDWFVEQSFLCESTNSISIDDVFRVSKSIITAPSGYGKTHCLHNIANKLSIQYLERKGESIPVLLRCGLWKRHYNTLEEGIYAELRHHIPSLTLESVKSELLANRFSAL